MVEQIEARLLTYCKISKKIQHLPTSLFKIQFHLQYRIFMQSTLSVLVLGVVLSPPSWEEVSWTYGLEVEDLSLRKVTNLTSSPVVVHEITHTATLLEKAWGSTIAWPPHWNSLLDPLRDLTPNWQGITGGANGGVVPAHTIREWLCKENTAEARQVFGNGTQQIERNYIQITRETIRFIDKSSSSGSGGPQ